MKVDVDASSQMPSRESVERLVLAWAYAVDSRDPDAAAALFTPDAVVDYGPRASQGPMVGRNAYLAFMREAMSDEPVTERSLIKTRTALSTHHVSNIVIDFEGADAGIARSYVVALAIQVDRSHLTTWSHVTDHVVRTPDGWRIARRRYDTVAYQRATD